MSMSLSEEMIAGLACTVCGTDYRDQQRPAVVVGHHSGGQLFACQGRCATTHCGSADGLGEEPALSLDERAAEFEVG
jgi:hypothetical protein